MTSIVTTIVWDRGPVSFLLDLPHAWVTIEVPGTSTRDWPATYVEYAIGDLPPVPRDVAHLEWLASAPRHSEDYMAGAFEAAARDLSLGFWRSC